MKTITKIILGLLLVSFNISQAQVELETINVQAKKNNSTEKSSFVEVRYYYYPNLQAYFDTKVGMYLYEEAGEWIEDEKLPLSMMGYSLKNGHYVMIENYTGEDPYDLLDEHKAKYPADYSSRPKRDVASN